MARPAMSSLLAYLDEHPENSYVVIFDDLKRFARDTIFHLSLRRELQKRRATVECLNFRFEDTPEGVFVETILAAQGELEREQNRRQVIQKQKARLERGYWPFYPPPGYKTRRTPQHGKLLFPDHPAADIYRESLEGFASGRFETQSDVQRFLVARGLSEYTGGGRIHLEKVRRLLVRIIYAGYIEYEPWGVSPRKGHHEPLIALSTYQRIQERLRATAKTYDRSTHRDEFPLRGFVLCARCLRPLTASWSTGRNARYPYYRCKWPSCEVRTKSIAKEQIETDFEGILTTIEPIACRLVIIEEVVHEVLPEFDGNVEARLRQRSAELADLDRQVAGYEDRIRKASSDMVIPLYEKELERLLLRKAALEDQPAPDTSCVQLGTALDEVFGYLKEPLALWRGGLLADRRWLLKVLFAEPPRYDLETGFGTADLSLPLAISRDFSGSHSQGVEMVRKNWNQLEQFIKDAHASWKCREPEKGGS